MVVDQDQCRRHQGDGCGGTRSFGPGSDRSGLPHQGENLKHQYRTNHQCGEGPQMQSFGMPAVCHRDDRQAQGRAEPGSQLDPGSRRSV